jgi:hypothetical protein
MENGKIYLMINGQYFSWSPDSMLCTAVSRDDFSHAYDSQKDKLTIVPRVVKEQPCPGCVLKTDEERQKTSTLPEKFENDADYLLWVYKNEKNPQLLIKGKAVYDEQNK